MYRTGHYGAALLAYAPLGSALASSDAWVATTGAVVALLFARFPDVDLRLPVVSHRGCTHTILFLVVITLLVATGTTFVADGIVTDPSVWGLVMGLATATSIGSHLAADALTPAGVPLCWPLSDNRYAAGVVPADDTLANLGLFFGGLSATAVAGYVPHVSGVVATTAIGVRGESLISILAAVGTDMEYYDGEPLRHMGDLPAMAAHRYGEKTALSFMGQETSFAELESSANSVANVLVDHGVSEGDRVGLYIPNTDQFPEAYFGAIKAGAIPVPLNLRMDPNTLEFVLGDGDVDHLIGSPLLAGGMDTEQGRIVGPTELAERAGVSNVYVSGMSDDGVVNYSQAVAEADDEFDIVDRAYDDVAVQPYTSGTTGKPKGVLLTHENLLSTIESYEKGGLPIDCEDSIVLVLPLFHIYALNAIQGTFLYNGSKMHLIPRPDPQMILQTISANDVTNFAGVPALFNMMWQVYREDPDAYDMDSLTDVICAAAPLADDTRRTIEQAWGVPMTEGWGMTETGPAGCVEPSRGVRKSAGCIGPALRGIELKLVDPETRETRISTDQLEPNPDDDIDFTDEEQVVGEIAIRGPNVFEGYYNRPEKTAQVFDDEGWFYTEDIARVDEDGYFWMVDRADDMIISGGENIYPAEVEDALYEHEDVAEAAVVAAPHEVKGEAPVAFVVLEEGVDLSEDDLREFTLQHVATYAHPRRVFFVDELPRSATQKVQRFKLEEEAEERIGGTLGSSEEL